MTRVSLRYLVAALVTLALAAFASASGVLPGKPTLEGTSDIDFGQPVPLVASEQNKLIKRVASFDGSCHPYARVPGSPQYAPVLDAVAASRCYRSGTGAQVITSYRFSAAEGLNQLFDVFRQSLRGANGACDGSSGITAWANRDGRLAGGILCYTQAGGSPTVLWTENGTNTLHLATAPNTNKLLEWWQREIRPQQGYPSKQERDLLTIVDARIDIKQCSRDDTGGSPMARAAIACAVVPGVKGNVASVHFERHSPSNLDRYLTDIFSSSTLEGIPRVDTPCQTRAFERGSWETAGGGTRGTLACFPRGGQRVLIWTLDDAGLYGYLSRDDDSSPAELYRTWQQSLQSIGS